MKFFKLIVISVVLLISSCTKIYYKRIVNEEKVIIFRDNLISPFDGRCFRYYGNLNNTADEYVIIHFNLNGEISKIEDTFNTKAQSMDWYWNFMEEKIGYDILEE